MKLISIVVPTYNMEEWLPRCLDSLVQNVSILDALEVLVVNDGSKDKSLAIAKDYASKYPDTIIAIDKPNGNYGSCVNRGLQNATGKYFRILDADDWVNTDGLVSLVELAKTIDVDAIFTHYTTEMMYEQKTFSHRLTSPILNKIIKSKDFGQLHELDVWEDFAMHKITYRAQLLKNIQFRHTEGISYTDSEYVYYPIPFVTSIYFADIYLYKYFVGREGQTVSNESKIKTISHLRKIIDRMLSTSLNHNISSYNSEWTSKYLNFILASYYHRILIIQKLTKQNNITLREFDNFLKGSNAGAYANLDMVSIKGVKWIQIWRKYNIQIIKPSLYNLLTKLFKKY